MELRPQFREIHLGMARESAERGELVMAGAVGDPPEGALFVFRYVDRSAAENFASHYPYVLNGLVTKWEVNPWAVVVGGEQ